MVKDDIKGFFHTAALESVSGKAARLNKTMGTFLDYMAWILSLRVVKHLHMRAGKNHTISEFQRKYTRLIGVTVNFKSCF